MFMISITFAPMSKQSAFDYKILASNFLPKGILEFFDLTAVNEDHPPPARQRESRPRTRQIQGAYQERPLACRDSLLGEL